MARKKKEKIEFVRDYGQWIVPESWNDITLKQMQEINKITKQGEDFNMYDCLYILCNKTKEEVEALPVPFFEEICNRMIFLKTSLPDVEPKPYVEIDGQRYQVNIINDLTVGEYEAIDTVLRTDEDNLATMLAVLCRKPDEKFDKTFQDKTFDERIKMFENTNILTVLPVITFFLQCWMILNQVSTLSSEVRENIEAIINDIQSSTKSGAFFPLLSKKRKVLKQLKKLKSLI